MIPISVFDAHAVHLEDRYGLHIDEADGEICLKVDVRKNKDATQLHEMRVLGDRLPPCSKQVRSRSKNTTVGVTAIPNLILLSVG